jgi:hypothetical protein
MIGPWGAGGRPRVGWQDLSLQAPTSLCTAIHSMHAAALIPCMDIKLVSLHEMCAAACSGVVFWPLPKLWLSGSIPTAIPPCVLLLPATHPLLNFLPPRPSDPPSLHLLPPGLPLADHGEAGGRA